LHGESGAASFRPSSGVARVISAIFQLIFVLIRLFIWALIAAAIFSMLAAFGVLDTRNRVVWSIGDFLDRITAPALRPIRNFLPNFGNIDISPIVLILLLEYLVVPLLGSLYGAIMYGAWQPLIF
jgi:YggT family protein